MALFCRKSIIAKVCACGLVTVLRGGKSKKMSRTLNELIICAKLYFLSVHPDSSHCLSFATSNHRPKIHDHLFSHFRRRMTRESELDRVNGLRSRIGITRHSSAAKKYYYETICNFPCRILTVRSPRASFCLYRFSRRLSRSTTDDSSNNFPQRRFRRQQRGEHFLNYVIMRGLYDKCFITTEDAEELCDHAGENHVAETEQGFKYTARLIAKSKIP